MFVAESDGSKLLVSFRSDTRGMGMRAPVRKCRARSHSCDRCGSAAVAHL